MQVTLVDPEPNPGGVCLYRGCIPSKALLHVADARSTRPTHADGVGRRRSAQPKIDIDKLRAFKNKVVSTADRRPRPGREAAQDQLHPGHRVVPRRDARSTIDARRRRRQEIADLRARIIATGSRPTTVPGLSIDSPRVMDSTGALDLPDVPKSLLVVGGGYIGLELGTVYAALGSKVTVVEMTDGLLPGADRDLVNILAKRARRRCSRRCC